MSATSERPPGNGAQDVDAEETREWLDALRGVIQTGGGERAHYLLETLIGKLAHRLMQLPGVIGVRVKIAKLEIFDDCEVAIRMQSGQW